MDEKSMVGKEEVANTSNSNELPESGGENEALNSKENFEKSPHPEWTYFIRDAEGIKIGRSISPASRMKDLQAGNGSELKLLVAVLSSRLSEREAHRKFKHLRTHREWFRPEPELLDFIDSIKAETRRAQRASRRNPLVAKLLAVRSAHGADSPMGYACSNLMELVPLMANYVRPAWATHKMQTLPWLIEQQVKRIEEIKASAN